MKSKGIIIYIVCFCQFYWLAMLVQKLKIADHGEAETPVSRGHPEKLSFLMDCHARRVRNDE